MKRTILSDYLWENRTRFSQKQFAIRLGISINYLSKLANGHNCPSISMAKLIEKETGGEIKWRDLLDDLSAHVEAKTVKE